MRHNNDRLFVFSGRMFAGKDFVAKSAHLRIKGFADPIYQLCEFFNGTSDKSVPGIRGFMQKLGQWGWGCVSEVYPHSTERAAITRAIREQGATMTRDFEWVNWAEFGRRQDFWVNIALASLGLTRQTFSSRAQEFLFPDMDPRAAINLAITNARFEHELKPCMRAGFRHFHVRCSEETRRLRMMASGYAFNEQADLDTSESMARALDSDMQDRRVIWNDTIPKPSGRNYLSLDEFVAVVRTDAPVARDVGWFNHFVIDSRQKELVLA